KPELRAKDRIGYEALRWAVLSTNQDISQRAFHVYRQLLNPLNHASVKVVLLILVGSIDQWENASKYQKNRQTVPKEFHECMRILDTLLKMAHALKQQQLLHEHPALFWAGIALLRANARNDNESELFDRGLELVGMNLDQAQNPQYFVEMEDWEARDEDANEDRRSVNTNTNNNNNNNNNNINKEKANENATKKLARDCTLQMQTVKRRKKLAPLSSKNNADINNINANDNAIPPDDLLLLKQSNSLTGDGNEQDMRETQYAAPMEDVYNNAGTNERDAEMEMEMQMEAAERDGLPEKFWNYCEEWTPRFEGVQQYLLQ
ncbi:centrosomal protein, partial [Reticulomyxa filosa]